MSSTSIGDAFEEAVYQWLNREISGGRFFGSPDQCRVYKKKAYYSRDRGSNIIFDVAIEVWLPKATSYSMLVLVECKKYSHPIPVNEVEEFYTKIGQVAGVNVKGVFVSSNSFQEGTFNFAKSKGMALVRYVSDAEVKSDLYRQYSVFNEVFGQREQIILHHGLTSEIIQSQVHRCYCYDQAIYSDSIGTLFGQMLASCGLNNDIVVQCRNNNTPSVDFLPAKYIEL